MVLNDLSQSIALSREGVKDLNLVIDGNARALSKLLDSVGDLSGQTHLLQVVVHACFQQNAGCHVASTPVLFVISILVSEDLFDFEPSVQNLVLSEHDAAFV